MREVIIISFFLLILCMPKISSMTQKKKCTYSFRVHFGVKMTSGSKNVIYRYQKRYKVKIRYHFCTKVKDQVPFMWFTLDKMRSILHNILYECYFLS